MHFENYKRYIYACILLLMLAIFAFFSDNSQETASRQTEADNTVAIEEGYEETEEDGAKSSDSGSEDVQADQEQGSEDANAEKGADAETESESSQNAVALAGSREASQYEKVIMVGDSRFVEMSNAVSYEGCQWICDKNAGLEWLEETALAQIESEIAESAAIVFNLGFNDIDKASDYVELLNNHVEEWTSSGTDVYFMTVNPVDRSYRGTAENPEIISFNSTMQEELSPWFGYIDTYNLLTDSDFTSEDGIHYTDETYVEIFEYCMNQLHVAIS